MPTAESMGEGTQEQATWLSKPFERFNTQSEPEDTSLLQNGESSSEESEVECLRCCTTFYERSTSNSTVNPYEIAGMRRRSQEACQGEDTPCTCHPFIEEYFEDADEGFESDEEAFASSSSSPSLASRPTPYDTTYESDGSDDDDLHYDEEDEVGTPSAFADDQSASGSHSGRTLSGILKNIPKIMISDSEQSDSEGEKESDGESDDEAPPYRPGYLQIMIPESDLYAEEEDDEMEYGGDDEFCAKVIQNDDLTDDDDDQVSEVGDPENGLEIVDACKMVLFVMLPMVARRIGTMISTRLLRFRILDLLFHRQR